MVSGNPQSPFIPHLVVQLPVVTSFLQRTDRHCVRVLRRLGKEVRNHRRLVHVAVAVRFLQDQTASAEIDILDVKGSVVSVLVLVDPQIAVSVQRINVLFQPEMQCNLVAFLHQEHGRSVRFLRHLAESLNGEFTQVPAGMRIFFVDGFGFDKAVVVLCLHRIHFSGQGVGKDFLRPRAAENQHQNHEDCQKFTCRFSHHFSPLSGRFLLPE